MGRPTKLKATVVELLVKGLTTGATYELACSYAGISYATLRNWIVKAEGIELRQQTDDEFIPSEEEEAYLEFLEAIKKAEGSTAIYNLAVIQNTARGRIAKDGSVISEPVWTAAAWLLERRYPHMYGRQVQEIKHEGGVTVNHIPPKELAKLDREIDDQLAEWEEKELGSMEEWDRPPEESKSDQ